MSTLITILLIGISLSMDAFSLALIYGMQKITKKQVLILSTIVGIYHFIMPIIGLTFGSLINSINLISINTIATLILVYIGVDLIISKNNEGEQFDLNLLGFLIFGLSVSIDSLTVGIGLRAITTNYLLSSTIFSLTSLSFTYLGLTLGTIIGNKVGNYSKKLGGFILIIIAIILNFY